MPVLAEATGQVASDGSEREDGRAGQEVVERFFLDWINRQAAGEAIGGGDQFVADPLLLQSLLMSLTVH